MNSQPIITLNDGFKMPQIGLGVFQIPAESTAETVKIAIGLGYRAVDTAAGYRNERGVGQGVRESGETVFVTTKLWNTKHGYDLALRTFDGSFEALGLPFIDLYLIHWPVPALNLYAETWKAFVQLRAQGRVRSIGVSNFAIPHLRRIIDETGVVPAVNQIELHPGFAQNELVAFHNEHGIATTSWSPLGRGQSLGNPVIGAIAAKHNRSPAQIIISWHLARGLIVIPKASTPERLAENFAALKVHLDAEDMAAIAKLDDPDGRIGPNPDRL